MIDRVGPKVIIIQAELKERLSVCKKCGQGPQSTGVHIYERLDEGQDFDRRAPLEKIEQVRTGWVSIPEQFCKTEIAIRKSQFAEDGIERNPQRAYTQRNRVI
jgi:hypothetical protein